MTTSGRDLTQSKLFSSYMRITQKPPPFYIHCLRFDHLHPPTLPSTTNPAQSQNSEAESKTGTTQVHPTARANACARPSHNKTSLHKPQAQQISDFGAGVQKCSLTQTKDITI